MTAIDAIPWVEALGWTLIHSVWQLAAVALATAPVMSLLRYRSAQLRYGPSL